MKRGTIGHENMENKWFLSMIRDDFRGGKINLARTLKLLEKLNIPCNHIHVKQVFKDNDRLKQGRITIEEFRSIYRVIAHREEITEIFNTYSEDRKFLYEKNLVAFLTQEQYVFNMNRSIVFEIIEKYEPIVEVKQARQMSLEGFTRYLCSSDCLVFNNEFRKVYQDMHHPLKDYFISSSHNTYLLSDQLVGPSDVWGYVSALVKGCRCLEIDCWDGSQNEPVVYHGYTLTSKLLFKTVIQAIHKYAFITSDYPVVLSLENHCSPSQQEVMADNLQSILGDTLLSDVLDDYAHELPSPEALKFRILVRNKKIGTLMETHARKGSDKHGQVEEYDEYEEIDQEEEEGKDKSSEPPDTLQVSSEKETQSSNVVKLPLFRRNKVKMAMALSDLVIYTKTEKFKNFYHSREHQQFNESNSIGESTARKLSKLKVALNFQTPGLPMDIQNGKFLDNGNSGYILKPQFLRDTETDFNPNKTPEDSNPVTLMIRVISGIQLPPSSRSLSNRADTLVIIEIFGVPHDQSKQQTRVIKKNAFNPRWNETFTFIIQVPELALIRFAVEHQNLLAGNELLGQYTLPVLCMSKGYRHVPLFSRAGENLEPASLFIYVWYVR
ncbi:phospholipase C zeta 1 [Phyllostomus discolor]|uniref:Phosphoinositide phospholipase C n=1 Tax=Phyllostomus discolor TaxID=89673 RepID=A0A834EKZ1_9CHIR|nr:phospholipase C zeta 1 [Phyllostomus discolor]